MHERAGADDLTRWDRLHLLRLHYVKTAAECPCREFGSFQVRKISRISSSIGSLKACLDQRRGEFQRRGESGLLCSRNLRTYSTFSIACLVDFIDISSPKLFLAGTSPSR
jgi:hypothetical protein